MTFKLITLLATGAALAGAPAAASADTLVTASPGAQNLATGGGYMVWSVPAEGGGFRLMVRSPDGAVAPADVPAFRTAPDPAIGTGAVGEGERQLLAVYGRDGDIAALDLRTGAETKIRGAATATYEEYAPGLTFGRLAFVRRGGRDNGVFVLNGTKLTKVTSARPRELQFNGSRVAYPSGRNVVVRRVSGRGEVSTIATPTPAFGLAMTRYTLAYAVRGGRLFRTNAFGGSGRKQNVDRVSPATQAFPVSLNSIAFSRGYVRYYADGEGIKRISAQDVFPR